MNWRLDGPFDLLPLSFSQLGEWQVLNLRIQEYARFGTSPWDNRRAAGTGGFIIPGSSILRSVKVRSVLGTHRAGGIVFANEHSYCNGNRKGRFSRELAGVYSQIAGQIGYPIVIWKTNNIGLTAQQASKDEDGSQNLVLGALLLDIDPSSPTWGQSMLANLLVDDHLGSFWVFAKDDSFSVNARLVEQICYFCTSIQKMIADELRPKDEIAGAVNRAHFDEVMIRFEDQRDQREEHGIISEPTVDDSTHAGPGLATLDKLVCDDMARRMEERVKETHWPIDEEAG